MRQFLATPPLKILKTFLPFFMLSFLSKTTFAQQRVDTPITNFVPQPPPDKVVTIINMVAPVSLTGRVLGVNLENVKSNILNKHSGETTSTDSNGIYHINVLKGDTLTFVSPKYSISTKGVKSFKENLNVVLIKRKTDSLQAGHSGPDYNKAHREDEELLRILEKDAKLEGKWNY